MAKWRVYNKHPQGLTHRESFRGEPVEIKAGDFILMDYEDAVLFKGQYFPMKKLPDDTQDPASFKVLHLEPDGAEEVIAEKPKFICQRTGKEFATEASLLKHLEQFKDEVFKDEALELELETDKKRAKGNKSA